VEQELRDAGAPGGIIEVNAKDGLVAAAGDVAEETVEGAPVEVGGAGHEGAQGHVIPLHAVGKRAVAALVGEETTEGIIYGRRSISEGHVISRTGRGQGKPAENQGGENGAEAELHATALISTCQRAASTRKGKTTLNQANNSMPRGIVLSVIINT